MIRANSYFKLLHPHLGMMALSWRVLFPRQNLLLSRNLLQVPKFLFRGQVPF
jgi:hypothetical protein